MGVRGTACQPDSMPLMRGPNPSRCQGWELLALVGDWAFRSQPMLVLIRGSHCLSNKIWLRTTFETCLALFFPSLVSKNILLYQVLEPNTKTSQEIDPKGNNITCFILFSIFFLLLSFYQTGKSLNILKKLLILKSNRESCIRRAMALAVVS